MSTNELFALLSGSRKPVDACTNVYEKLIRISRSTQYTAQKRASAILEALLVIQSEWKAVWGDQAEHIRVLQHSVSLTISMFSAKDSEAVMLVYGTRRTEQNESSLLTVVNTLLGQISQARIFALLEQKKKDEEKKEEKDEKYPECPGCGGRHKPSLFSDFLKAHDEEKPVEE